MSTSVCFFKSLLICSLLANVLVASAQSLQARRRASRASSAVAFGLSKEQQDEAELLATKLKDVSLKNRMMRILDEPCPIALADISFSNAVVMAKSGDADGYFALSLHYSAGDAVEGDADKAWHLLRKSADMGCPIATLFFAMAEELRIYDLSNDWNGDPDFHMYMTNRQVRCAFCPFTPATNIAFSVRRRLSRYSLDPWERNDDGYMITNQVHIATVREWYEKAIALGVSGARGELERFEDRVTQALSEIAERDRSAAKKRDKQLSNAEFAKMMLDIPVESKDSIWQKSQDAIMEERRRSPSLSERVTALEKRLEKEGR